MEEFAAQIISAIRNEDVGGWINILVIVLVAVSWAVWGVLKTRSKKTEAEDEDEDVEQQDGDKVGDKPIDYSDDPPTKSAG
jgi:hypothetical protein